MTIVSNTAQDFSVLILAGGQGKRMQSALPKVLTKLGNKMLLEHVLDTAKLLCPKQTLVVIPQASTNIFSKHIKQHNPQWIEQSQPLGTAHAVYEALAEIHTKHVLVLYADVPLTSPSLLENFIKQCGTQLGIITAICKNPHGYGRIIRDSQKNITAIIEQKDCDQQSNAIKEINSGIGFYPVDFLKQQWKNIQNNNQQQEFYLTDYVKIWSKSKDIKYIVTEDLDQISGINNLTQLHTLERIWQKNYAKKLLENGVHIADINRFDCRGELNIDSGCYIDINCIFIGKVSIGRNCHIGANCILENVNIGDNTNIQAMSILRNSKIDEYAKVGPFAYAKDKTHLAKYAQIGCFVETKSTYLGQHSKANHLAYLGNMNIEEHVNIGAGVIHCNYNGINKFTSTIKKQAFIGANSQIVGPVIVHEQATVGAGSTITKDVPAAKLTLARSRQKTIEHWESPRKREYLQSEIDKD